MTQKFIIEDIGPLPWQTHIQGQDAKHICKVLRLGSNDPINLTDGQGQDYRAIIQTATPSQVDINIVESMPSKTESPIQITLCTALLKDKKMDLVIKHVTQLGIQKWVPFFSHRSVPTPASKRLENRIARWNTISRESLKQCQRSRLVKISTPLTFQDLMEYSQGYDYKFAFWEKSATPIKPFKKDKSTSSVIILIGPEGGFTQSEITMAQENGFQSYSLGPRILRAETACLTATTLVQHLLGDI